MIKSNLIKMFIISLMLIYLIGRQTSNIVFSQTPASSSADEDIKALKDKIATKVAKLREQNNKAISGFVTTTDKDKITIKTTDDLVYDVKLDITKYFQVKSGGKSEIKLDDIKKDNFIIVTGVLNEKSIDANFIYIDESFIVKAGKISQINADNYRLTVVTADKDNYNLDIETKTKQQIINNKTLEIEKVGFSKIKEGDTIHFVAQKTGGEKNNTYSAQKILILPQEYFMQ